MRKLHLLTTGAVVMLGMVSSALAADMPVKAPVMMPPPPFSWTGFYVGGNFGVAWGERNVTDLFGLNFNTSSSSVPIGGGQIGFNYQMNSFVLGVEADFDWFGNNNRTGAGVAVPGIGTLQASLGNKSIATVAARVGYAADHWLFYGKFGGGWVNIGNLTITNLNNGLAITGSNSRTADGFLVGVGLEYAIANNWTIKAEYDFLDLGSRSFVVPAGAPFLVADVITTKRNIQEFKIGFNYLFNRVGY